MTGNIRLYRKNALREAFAAGQQSALADPTNMKTIFDAGEKKGAAWLNEAINAPSFMEIMSKRRSDSPGDFASWMNVNEKKLCIPVVENMFSDGEDETLDVIFVKGTRKVTMEAIESAVSQAFNTDIMVLKHNRRRLKEIKTPRYFCFYLAYFHCEDRLEDIGERWGQKDHATVIHGAGQISNNAITYPEDKEKLMDAYVWLIKSGYNIDNIYTGERYGNRRRSVEFINLEI